MSQPILWFILCLSAYLIGSIPFGYIIGKLLHRKDIRTGGSGNIGATNALRQYGVKTGILVMLLDMLKGFIVAWLLLNVVQDAFAGILAEPRMSHFVFYLPLLSVILGHMFSVFLGFKGGKGVATAAGVFICLIPIPVIVVLLVFVGLTALTKYVSVGSIGAALSLLLVHFLWDWLALGDLEFPWFTLIVVALIIYKHTANIQRLLEKRENKLSFNKKGAS